MSMPSISQKRWAAIWLRRLSTDRIKRTAFAPDKHIGLATYAKVGSAHLIAAVDDAAALLGIVPGMTLVDARSLQPNLQVLEAEGEADETLLLSIADFCERWSASVTLEPPGYLFLEISGAAHLFGGEGGLRAAIIDALARQSISAHVAIADTVGAARALVRAGQATAPPGGCEQALRPLPISLLHLDSATTDLLKRIGLKTIGALIDRPSMPLSARIGEAVVRCLDEALGRAEPALTFRRPPPAICVMRHFLEPLIDIEAILIAAADASQDIAQTLRDRGLGARRISVSLFDASDRQQRLQLGLSQSEQDPFALIRPLEEQFRIRAQDYSFEFGVDALRFDVLETSLYEPEKRNPDGQLIDALSARLGRKAVFRVALGKGHWPELSSTALFAEDQIESVSCSSVCARPQTLFEHPEPVVVVATVPDGAPRLFRWRHILHEVAHAEGPERIASPWTLAAPTRDYFRVEDKNGARFWLFREGLFGRETENPAWFMHGLFA